MILVTSIFKINGKKSLVDRFGFWGGNQVKNILILVKKIWILVKIKQVKRFGFWLKGLDFGVKKTGKRILILVKRSW